MARSTIPDGSSRTNTMVSAWSQKIESGNVRLYSRNGQVISSNYIEVARALEAVRADAVIDVELVVQSAFFLRDLSVPLTFAMTAKMVVRANKVQRRRKARHCRAFSWSKLTMNFWGCRAAGHSGG